MILSITINGILGLAMLLATLFCLGNVEDVITFPFPFMAIFKGAAGTAGGTAMSALVVIMLICALIAFVATASRMTWSFARDRGLPGWKRLSKVSSSVFSRGWNAETVTGQPKNKCAAGVYRSYHRDSSPPRPHNPRKRISLQRRPFTYSIIPLPQLPHRQHPASLAPYGRLDWSS
jgi:hypothetical protein